MNELIKIADIEYKKLGFKKLSIAIDIGDEVIFYACPTGYYGGALSILKASKEKKWISDMSEEYFERVESGKRIKL